jgi:hypothetical protein
LVANGSSPEVHTVVVDRMPATYVNPNAVMLERSSVLAP